MNWNKVIKIRNKIQKTFDLKSLTTSENSILQNICDKVPRYEEGTYFLPFFWRLLVVLWCVTFKKLKYYAIRGFILNPIRNYFSGSTQFIKINKTRENPHWIPQGSVLGLLLFIISINDLFLYLSSDWWTF